jgi:hypothetical protein
MINGFKSILKKNLPVFLLRILNRAGLYPGFIPRQGTVSFGDFNSLVPFSSDFGLDLGGPIERN